MDKDITNAGASFYSFYLELLRYIESKWELLVKDIELGTIDESIQMPDELSTRIHEFCLKYTDNKDKVGKLALCIEEIVGNIVKYGFTDRKIHSIDIRIIVLDDDIILRIRDDGVPFNPIQYDDENQSMIGETIGIHLVRKSAKEMNYNAAIGLNNFTIVL